MLQTIFGETASKKSNISKRVVGIARDVVQSISKRNSHVLFKNRIIFLGPHDIFRFLIEIKTKHVVERDILLRNLYHAEQSSPGSSLILLNMLSEEKKQIESISKLSKKDLEGLISSCNIDILSAPLCNAINLCGPSSTIIVKKVDRKSYVMCSNSLEFPITQIKEFGETIELNGFYIVLYDGIVERVSQIERLINKQIETKVPVLLLSRGFGYEVVSTLLENFRHGRLNIIPVTTDVDWTSEFVIKDISSCSKISETNLEINESRLFENVKIQNSKLFFNDIGMSKEADSLSKKIAKEFSSLNLDKQILEKRLKSLSSVKIEVAVGNEFGDSADVVLDRINFINRMMVSSRNEPIVKVKIRGVDLYCAATSFQLAKKIIKSINDTTMAARVVRNVG